jgi:hypothetical protein
MCDLDVIQKIRSIVSPSSKIYPRISEKYRTQYEITVSGKVAAQWMMTIYSLMGSRRREKIREVLNVWKNYKFVDKEVVNEKISQKMKLNRLIEIVMMSRKVSRAEAEEILGDCLTPTNQTIN